MKLNTQQFEHAIQSGILLSAKAHMWHLSTVTYSKHILFQELYETLTEQADRLAEVYMGAGFHILAEGTSKWQTEFNPEHSWKNELEDYLTELENLSIAITEPNFSFLKSTVDDVVSQLRRVFYKLNRLS